MYPKRVSSFCTHERCFRSQQCARRVHVVYACFLVVAVFILSWLRETYPHACLCSVVHLHFCHEVFAAHTCALLFFCFLSRVLIQFLLPMKNILS